MRIETKIVEKNMEDYKKFGWEFAEETSVKHGRAHHKGYILTRDMDRPHYREILILETRYFNLKDKLETYEKPDGLAYFVLFLLFLVPGIIFATYQSRKESKIEDWNNKVKNQMYKVEMEAKRFLEA